jgi:hypothetical protein
LHRRNIREKSTSTESLGRVLRYNTEEQPIKKSVNWVSPNTFFSGKTPLRE